VLGSGFDLSTLNSKKMPKIDFLECYFKKFGLLHPKPESPNPKPSALNPTP